MPQLSTGKFLVLLAVILAIVALFWSPIPLLHIAVILGFIGVLVG